MENLIPKYIDASISQEEIGQLLDWLKNPNNQEIFKSYARVNHYIDFAHLNMDEKKAYDNIRKRIVRVENPSRQKGWSSWYKYAAVFVMILTGTYLLFFNQSKNDGRDFKYHEHNGITLEMGGSQKEILNEDEQQTLYSTDSTTVVHQMANRISYVQSSTIQIAPQLQILTVPYGKRFQIELADGTLISLNAGTKITYPSSFDGLDHRSITVDGEALFEVTKNPDKPFIVSTNDMNVRVLGTTFNVNSYKNDDNASVVLIEGNVAVYPKDKAYASGALSIVPGEQATFKDGRFHLKKVSVRKHIAWTSGKLYFENDRFDQIVKQLQRYYNIEIINNYKRLGQSRYTGVFENTELTEILNIFQSNTPFDYYFKNGKIVIEPQ